MFKKGKYTVNPSELGGGELSILPGLISLKINRKNNILLLDVKFLM